MREVRFRKTAFEQYSQWATEDVKTFSRISKIIQET